MDLQIPTQATSSQPEPIQPEIPQQVERKRTKKLFFVIIVVLVVFTSGCYMLYSQMYKDTGATKMEKSSNKSPSTTKKDNLNPNSGNLYQDLKIRMKEVLK